MRLIHWGCLRVFPQVLLLTQPLEAARQRGPGAVAGVGVGAAAAAVTVTAGASFAAGYGIGSLIAGPIANFIYPDPDEWKNPKKPPGYANAWEECSENYHDYYNACKHNNGGKDPQMGDHEFRDFMDSCMESKGFKNMGAP